MQTRIPKEVTPYVSLDFNLCSCFLPWSYLVIEALKRLNYKEVTLMLVFVLICVVAFCFGPFVAGACAIAYLFLEALS